MVICTLITLRNISFDSCWNENGETFWALSLTVCFLFYQCLFTSTYTHTYALPVSQGQRLFWKGQALAPVWGWTRIPTVLEPSCPLTRLKWPLILLWVLQLFSACWRNILKNIASYLLQVRILDWLKQCWYVLNNKEAVNIFTEPMVIIRYLTNAIKFVVYWFGYNLIEGK